MLVKSTWINDNVYQLNFSGSSWCLEVARILVKLLVVAHV